MAQRAEGKLYPIQHYVKIMLVISFSVLVLDFIISFASISIVKQQSARYLRDTASLYLDRINSNFAYINHFMGWTLANDENLKTMNKLGSLDGKFIKAKNDLYKRFAELQKGYGEEYDFFLYLSGQDFLVNCAPMNLTYAEYGALQDQIRAFVKDKNLYEKYSSRWSTLSLGGTHYIFNIIPYNGTFLICLVSADDLIRPLRQIDLGKNGYISLIDEEGKSVASPVLNNGKALTNGTESMALQNLVRSRTTVKGEFSNASFYVRLVIQFGAFEKIMIAQLLIVLLAAIVACSLGFMMLYIKNKVLKPIKSFSYNLAFWTGDGELKDIGDSKLAELEKANTQFLNLVKQVREFKIDIYERELEKRSIQLDYMKLQIKPHFFLNCLTTIYSMAQMQMHEEIQRMALSTSEYFRYIFKHGQDFVRLEDEIGHVRVYLEIQKNRYRDSFAYRIEQSDRSRGTLVPPLVLQTFVENAMKYGVSRENESQISLAADRRTEAGEEWTVIRIADTGPGFAADILEKLAGGQPLDQTDGSRIGIMNTVQRLGYLYRQKAKVRFYNGEAGGACIELLLPNPPGELPERGESA
ncbi:cache domain-containing sensor histidine kinase [Cohnella zeiphila]|uniref:Histidine kinase n=1 Tax=Cohnella zeiphila TaxID=2761120 RepID=A0A7X0VU44_9BACL|nr:histidine kinase [Cohnella zeiphila]MBB6729862.1 histidine kinase [Cohnella zeiphila]